MSGGEPAAKGRAGLHATRPRVPRAATVIACLLGLFWANSARAQTKDLARRWQTVQSEHFEVNYPEPLALVARRVLAVAETANAKLVPIFGHQPKKRVQIVLNDDTDGANGNATPLNYNVIRLFVSAPDDLSVLGDFDDWLTILVTHEHSHILHLDNIGGLPRIVNEILGKVWAPNVLLPRWMTEGIATYLESAETAGGRLRSTQFEMYMRTAVLENNLLHFDTLNNRTDYWPHGDIWYLYGSRFIEWLVEQYGEEIILEMTQWYGRRAIPYSVNRMGKRLTGNTFGELYELWIDDMRRRYGEIEDAVRSQGMTNARRITFRGETIRGLRFADDQRLIYYASDGRSDEQIRMLDLARGNEVERVVRSLGESYPTMHPNGDLYFESVDAYKTNIYSYYDLFRLDSHRPWKRKRLTWGLRARYPDISPDGRWVSYVRNEASTQSLWIASLDDIEGTQEVLVQSGRFEQVYTPRFSPDGTKVAYSVWRKGGYRDVHVIDLASREITRVTHDRALDTGPAWSPDGHRLYFSSDRTGIANIYAWEPATGAVLQVTNVISGAYTPAPSPDGKQLAYIGYTSRGYDIYVLDLDPDTGRPASAYVDRRPPPSDADALISDLSTRYVGARTFYPRFWGIDLQEDAFGRQLGIYTRGEDAARFHLLFARLGVSLKEGYVNAELVYTLQRLPPNLTASFFRTVTPRGGFVVNGQRLPYVEDAYGGRLSVDYTVPRSFHANRISASYGLTWTRSLSGFDGPIDPNFAPPIIPSTGLNADIRLGWSYNDARRHLYDYTPSEGRTFGASISFAHPAIGSRFESIVASWFIQRFIEMPWVQHHVLAFRYGGGAGEDSRGERGSFALGGFPNTSLLDQLLNSEQLGGVALRGYPAASIFGDRFQLLQTEYRFPLTRVLRGPGTVPVFFDRMYGLVFFDYGDAYFGPLDLNTFRKGAGAEILMNFTLGYVTPYSLRLGFAYGFDEGGGTQLYVNFGRPF
ncbi:MAG: DPP IV N-terminal domain-containing protein [Myxococcales bacterium]|nr:DPP IV N-terminal domain-containing protein [Myxococcales bacterium]